jgi:hypothetical protein
LGVAEPEEEGLVTDETRQVSRYFMISYWNPTYAWSWLSA